MISNAWIVWPQDQGHHCDQFNWVRFLGNESLWVLSHESGQWFLRTVLSHESWQWSLAVLSHEGWEWSPSDFSWIRTVISQWFLMSHDIALSKQCCHMSHDSDLSVLSHESRQWSLTVLSQESRQQFLIVLSPESWQRSLTVLFHAFWWVRTVTSNSGFPWVKTVISHNANPWDSAIPWVMTIISHILLSHESWQWSPTGLSHESWQWPSSKWYPIGSLQSYLSRSILLPMSH